MAGARAVSALAEGLDELDADEVCVLAGEVVTRAYRTFDPDAAKIDAAHGRLWARTRGQGTLSPSDPDVAIIVAAALAVGP